MHNFCRGNAHTHRAFFVEDIGKGAIALTGAIKLSNAVNAKSLFKFKPDVRAQAIADDGSGSPEIDSTDNTFVLATSLGEAVIGGAVWVDINTDGVFDAGEPALAGVTVELTHLASGTVTPALIAGDGSFAFGSLAAGDFRVDVVASTLPPGITASIASVTLISSGSGTADPTLITVSPGQVWHASFPYVGTSFIGGTIWSDLDGDGALDPGEPGLGGVTVRAEASGYTWISVSGAGGDYRFDDLPPDTYTIDVLAGEPANAAVTAGSLPILVGLAPGIGLGSLDIGYHELADLALAVNLYEAPKQGEPISFVFTVVNNGPAMSGALTLSGLLPGGFDYSSASGTGWTCTLTTQLTCSGMALAAGASTTVAITGVVSASNGVALTILGAITSTTPDDDLSNNQAALSAGVGQLPQTGINADKVGLYGLLLMMVGGFLLLWAVLADRRRRQEDEELPAT